MLVSSFTSCMSETHKSISMLCRTDPRAGKIEAAPVACDPEITGCAGARLELLATPNVRFAISISSSPGPFPLVRNSDEEEDRTHDEVASLLELQRHDRDL